MDVPPPVIDVMPATPLSDEELPEEHRVTYGCGRSYDACDLVELVDLLSVLDPCSLSNCDPGCHLG